MRRPDVPARTWKTRLAQMSSGMVLGLSLVVVGHQASKIVGHWAVARGFVELNGGWLAPRFIAWAIPAVLSALLLRKLFRDGAMVPAVIAALMVPLLYIVTFAKFFGLAQGFALARPYAFESLVVLLALPGAVYALRKKHGHGR